MARLTSVWRFAPSPNGYLHLGHAYSALMNFFRAQQSGGRFLLRIEDIDQGRARLEFEQAIYEDLAWLGLRWEQPVRRQSEHFLDYAHAITHLRTRNLLYPCYCSRAEILTQAAQCATWPRDPDGAPLYSGRCKALTQPERNRLEKTGRRPAWRLDAAAALALTQPISWWEYRPSGQEQQIIKSPLLWGDPILVRRDTPSSYHLSVVVDDALQGVTDILRGVDLFHATSLHRLLQILLQLPEPRYHHHPLILDHHGEKLAKSKKSVSLRALRRKDLKTRMGSGRPETLVQTIRRILLDGDDTERAKISYLIDL